jgi:hypothetical protein
MLSLLQIISKLTRGTVFLGKLIVAELFNFLHSWPSRRFTPLPPWIPFKPKSVPPFCPLIWYFKICFSNIPDITFVISPGYVAHVQKLLSSLRSRVSSVGIVITLRAEWQRKGVSILVTGKRVFSSPKRPKRLWDLRSLLFDKWSQTSTPPYAYMNNLTFCILSFGRFPRV